MITYYYLTRAPTYQIYFFIKFYNIIVYKKNIILL